MKQLESIKNDFDKQIVVKLYNQYLALKNDVISQINSLFGETKYKDLKDKYISKVNAIEVNEKDENSIKTGIKALNDIKDAMLKDKEQYDNNHIDDPVQSDPNDARVGYKSTTPDWTKTVGEEPIGGFKHVIEPNPNNDSDLKNTYKRSYDIHNFGIGTGRLRDAKLGVDYTYLPDVPRTFKNRITLPSTQNRDVLIRFGNAPLPWVEDNEITDDMLYNMFTIIAQDQLFNLTFGERMIESNQLANVYSKWLSTNIIKFPYMPFSQASLRF